MIKIYIFIFLKRIMILNDDKQVNITTANNITVFFYVEVVVDPFSQKSKFPGNFICLIDGYHNFVFIRTAQVGGLLTSIMESGWMHHLFHIIIQISTILN